MTEEKIEKAVFVGIIRQNDDERKVMEYLDELEFLAETAGATGDRTSGVENFKRLPNIAKRTQ